MHEVAKDFGYALQYSVFICDLTRLELVRLRAALLSEINNAHDSVAIMDLGPATRRGTECIEFIGARPSFPADGPTIW